jgi:molybdopterin converting factor small subunit
LAKVILSGRLRDAAGVTGPIEIDARNVRELLHKLEAKVPGISRRIDAGLSIAIDGDIVPDPLLEALGPDSEIHFLPSIQGGAA